MGKLSDRIDRRKVLFVLHLVLIAVASALSVGQVLFLSQLVLLLGAAAFTLYPLSLTQVLDNLEPSQFAAGTASLLLLYGVGSVTGPLVTAGLVAYVGGRGVFVSTGIGCLVALACGVSSLIRRPITGAAKEPFVSVPRTTSVAYEMDPRIEIDQS